MKGSVHSSNCFLAAVSALTNTECAQYCERNVAIRSAYVIDIW